MWELLEQICRKVLKQKICDFRVSSGDFSKNSSADLFRCPTEKPLSISLGIPLKDSPRPSSKIASEIPLDFFKETLYFFRFQKFHQEILRNFYQKFIRKYKNSVKSSSGNFFTSYLTYLGAPERTIRETPEKMSKGKTQKKSKHILVSTTVRILK